MFPKVPVPLFPFHNIIISKLSSKKRERSAENNQREAVTSTHCLHITSTPDHSTATAVKAERREHEKYIHTSRHVLSPL